MKLGTDILWLSEAIGRRVGRVFRVFNGYFGGCWGRERELSTEENLLVGSEYERMARGCSDAVLRRLLRGNVYRRVGKTPFEAFRASFEKAKGDCPMERALWVEQYQRDRQRISMQLRELETIGMVQTPFTDTDIVDFLLRVPVELRLKNRLYKSLIIRDYPSLARIPHSGKGLALTATAQQQRLQWRLEQLRCYVLPELSGGLYHPHSYSLTMHFSEWFQKSNRQAIENVLLDNEDLSAFMDPKRVNGLVREFMERWPLGRRDYESIAVLLTVATFIRLFCREHQKVSDDTPVQVSHTHESLNAATH